MVVEEPCDPPEQADGEAEGAKRDTCRQGDLRTKPERRETEERGTFA
jgi:hypothetical protein